MIDSFTDALLKSLDAEGLVVVKKGSVQAAKRLAVLARRVLKDWDEGALDGALWNELDDAVKAYRKLSEEK